MGKVEVGIGKKGARSCGSCTKCCEGWLTANIHGEEMYPGKACQFCEVDKGCSDYENRPENPCKTFVCMWRAEEFVPEEFSPKETGNIITAQRIGNIEYLSLVYAGKEVQTDFLSWFVSFCVGRQLNAEWVVNGKAYLIGSHEFVTDMRIRSNTAT